MKPLFVLLVAFALSLFVIKIFNGQWNFQLAGTESAASGGNAIN